MPRCARKVTAVGEDIHQLAWADVCGVAVRINIALVCEGSPQELIGPVGVGARRLCHEPAR
ncbi:hydrogenase 2 accessory protein HypG [Serratia fonticola]|uniref:Hydrogenase 2 accessory protein HypG n=1 Tax=Serratia fonticola TaxID=47917 RepID=A0A4U9THL8_SERFO|nr:hydrogenase 2 accessory protein HypG [Serratia fonticola]